MADKIIAANWKMNGTAKSAYAFFRRLSAKLASISQEILSARKLIICPPFTALYAASRSVQSISETAGIGKRISIGSQDIFFADKGAYTGEISAEMLKEFNVEFSIVGHSERRNIIGEGNEAVGRKLRACLKNSISPILCVGEKLEEREKGQQREIVGKQLKECLEGITAEQLPKIVIAYEPVWAIGTGVNASPEQAEEMHIYIRNFLTREFSRQSSSRIYILYGGSVNRQNAAELARMPNINGFLVGGASLEADHFADIVALS